MVLSLSGCRTAAQKEMERALDTTVLEEIHFRGAPIPEVIASLVDFTKELDSGKSVLELKAENPNIMFLDSPEKDGMREVEFIIGCSIPEITLYLRDVSLRDVLVVVCEIADLSFRIDREGEIVIDKLRVKDPVQGLRNLRIEEFGIDGQTLEEAVQLLAKKICEVTNSYGLTFKVVDWIEVETVRGASDPFGFETGPQFKPEFLKRTITIHKKNISAWEILMDICREGELRYEQDPMGVIVLKQR